MIGWEVRKLSKKLNWIKNNNNYQYIYLILYIKAETFSVVNFLPLLWIIKSWKMEGKCCADSTPGLKSITINKRKSNNKHTQMNTRIYVVRKITYLHRNDREIWLELLRWLTKNLPFRVTLADVITSISNLNYNIVKK